MNIEILLSDSLDTIGTLILKQLDYKSLAQCKLVNKHLLKYIENHKQAWICELKHYINKSYLDPDLLDFWKRIQDSDMNLEDFKTFIQHIRDYFKEYQGAPSPNAGDFIFGNCERLTLCFKYLRQAEVQLKIGLMEHSPLHQTIIKGWTDLFHKILDQYPDMIHSRNRLEENPLHVALKFNQMNMADDILKKAVDDPQYIANDLTALHFAVKHGTFEIFKKIAAFQNEVNPVLVLDNTSRSTPLHIACEKWKNDIAVYIIQRLDFNQATPEDNIGLTPLHLTATSCNVELFKILASKTKNMNVRANNGKTPLYYALFPEEAKLSLELPTYDICREKQLELVDFILEFQPKVDVKLCFDNGQTLLHLLAESGDFEMFKKIANNFQDINPKNDNGYTPLHYANSLTFFTHIYDRLKDPSDKFAKASNGDTIAHTAAKRGDTDILKFLHDQGLFLDQCSDLIPWAIVYGRRRTCEYLRSVQIRFARAQMDGTQ